MPIQRPVRRYRYSLVDDKVLCITPRAASTSMGVAIDPYMYDGKLTRLTQEQALEKREEGYEVLMWHREPFSRVASAYSVIGYDDPNSYADKVLLGEDAHVKSQRELHTINGTFLPTQVYKLENSLKTWDWEFPELPLTNFYHNKPDESKYTWDQLKELIDPVKVAAIEAKFSDDLTYHMSLAI